MGISKPKQRPLFKERMSMNVQKDGLVDLEHGVHPNGAFASRCRGGSLEGGMVWKTRCSKAASAALVAPPKP